ncbi:MAG: superinfection immunity protein [Terracidiphilus sp.]
MFHLPVFFCLLALYLLPTIVASARHLYCRTGIVLLNVFLGWTFIGWVAALIWALAAPASYGYYVQPPYPPYR